MGRVDLVSETPRSTSDAAANIETQPHLDRQIEIEFSGFYRAQCAGLVTFLLWLGASAHDAMDVAQETMIDAYRHWRSIRNPRAWIRKVASRKFARRLATVEEPRATIEPSLLQRRDVDIDAWEQRQAVLSLLGSLPLRQRQVMAWFYDGYEPAEIAAALHVSPENVRSNLHKARRALTATRFRGEGDRDES
jgi:RNA polymerase sigma-70 factor (ECF subfamily)